MREDAKPAAVMVPTLWSYTARLRKNLTINKNLNLLQTKITIDSNVKSPNFWSCRPNVDSAACLAVSAANRRLGS